MAVAIILFAMVGNAAHIIYRDYQDTLQRRYTMVRDMAKVVDEHVHRVIRGASVSLDQAASLVLEAGDVREIRSLDHWKRLREYAAHIVGDEAIWIFDPDGRTVLESASYPGRALSIVDRDYFQAAMSGDRLFIGPAVIGRTSEKRLVFTISRPVRDREGRLLCVVVVGMSVDHLTDFYDLLEFDYNPLIGVYRPNGDIIARRPNMRDMVGRNVGTGEMFQTKLKEAPEGLFISPSVLDGVSRVAAYRTMRDFGLIVLTGIDQDEAMAEWRTRALFTGGEALISVLVILATMAWGLRYLDRERRTQLRLADAQASAEQAGAERDEVTRLAAALSRAKEAADEARHLAEEANRSKGEFLASLSHELRTPLNAVIGFSDLIAGETEGPLGSPQYRHFAVNARDSGQHLLELINEILDHAKAEAGALRLDEATVDLEAAATFAVRMLMPRAERAGVRLTVAVAPEVRFVRADERRLRQIILNLIANAVTYTPAGGSVTVSAVREIEGQENEGSSGRTLTISVIDTGLGISADDVDRVMQPFTRVDTAANRKIEGTGLGLPLTKRLVELHDGSLSLRSTLGVGTTVTVRLPGDRILAPPPPRPTGVVVRPSGPLTILVVEDDPTIRFGVVELLRGWGYRVIEAANANAALVVLTGPEPVDVLFSDIVMPPGMPGTELAWHALRLRPGLPILLASGFAAHAVGADDEIAPGVVMIAKPYAVDDLKAQLNRVRAEVTERAAASAAPPAPPTPPAGRPPRLLIAEDMPINRELLAAIFRDSGYRLDLVADGAAAVDAVRKADYDLILMDVHMPGMDGLTATRAIRAMAPPQGRIPILALTAGSMPEELAACREAGMGGHIGKPYDRERLLKDTAKTLAAAASPATA